jgi:hypothetical protein
VAPAACSRPREALRLLLVGHDAAVSRVEGDGGAQEVAGWLKLG